MTKRPLTLSDYIGQERMKKQLKVTISACQRMNEPLPHILFSGGAGLGKTTIAKIISEETGAGFFEVMANNINTIEDLADIFGSISEEQYDIIFIDEIHKLPQKIEELLYPIMEDFIVEAETKDSFGRSRLERMYVPKFTLIGATTLAGDLTQPLRDRFGLHFTLQRYSHEEVARIIGNLAKRWSVSITDNALMDIAKRSKGTARIAINYFNRCREYATFLGKKIVDEVATNEQFSLLGIDEIGLDEQDYSVLEYLATQSAPIGIDTLATATSIDKNTIQTIIEPYLVQQRLMDRTRSGRRITPRGLDWIYSSGSYSFDSPLETAQTIVQSSPSGIARFGSRR